MVFVCLYNKRSGLLSYLYPSVFCVTRQEYGLLGTDDNNPWKEHCIFLSDVVTINGLAVTGCRTDVGVTLLMSM